MPGSQYGHRHGVNLANYRLLSQANERKALSYRSPADWAQETRDHLIATGTEQTNSSSLRRAGSALQNNASELVVSDLANVEGALRVKIAQTESLKTQLERMVMDVESEIVACGMVKCQLEERLSKVEHKAALNSARLQAREGRPTRERTMDEVERNLLHQSNLITSFTDKVKRAISHVVREVEQLEGVKARLVADLHDKADAIDVDNAVLAVGPNGEICMSPTGRRAEHPMRTPHTWIRSTEENLGNARHWLADSARLRKAVKHAINAARTVEHEVSKTLNAAMMQKLGHTQALKDDLQAQLTKVGEEMTKVGSQRHQLAAALEAKRGPLSQAKERWAMRKARPCRETVQDEVEAALVKEVAHLNAVTGQLSDKVRSVDKELDALALASAMLEDNLRDKEAALALDERCVMLDGRINIATGPPSSVVSAAFSSTSTAKSATLRRIGDIEAEILAARREREALESSLSELRTTLAVRPPSPSKLVGPVSPGKGSQPSSPSKLSTQGSRFGSPSRY